MNNMKLQTGKPLDIAEIINLTGRDALADMDGNIARIMNFSEGQTVECEKAIEWKGYFWGLKRVPRDRYDYLAFIAVR